MRNAAFVFVGVFLILVQGNLYRVLGPLEINGLTPNLVLPLLIHLGVQEASMARGAILSFVLGYFLDLCAGAPIGLFTFVSVALWWLSRLAGVRLTAQTLPTQMSLALVFASIESAIVLMLLAIFGGDAHRPLEMLDLILPHAISTALISPVGFWIARKLQTDRAPVHRPIGEGLKQ